MSNWWVSFYYPKTLAEWEYHGPWWVSGSRVHDDAATICAAVVADREEDAKNVILDAFDERPADLEWRFVTDKGADWDPFGGDRFKRAEWMKWPWPVAVRAAAPPTEGSHGS